MLHRWGLKCSSNYTEVSDLELVGVEFIGELKFHSVQVERSDVLLNKRL